ncbi:hypothetical protein P7K49_025242, partial [Saguinus oedipus]
VNHKRDKTPADGKLAPFEKLLQSLLGLFAQLHHGDGRGALVGTFTATTASEIRKGKKVRRRNTRPLRQES